MKIIFFILLSLVTLGAVYLSVGNEGYIIIEFLGYHMEIAPSLAIIALAAIFLIFFIISYFLILLKNIPDSLRKYYKEKRNRQDLLLLLDGFDGLYNADLAEVKKIAKKIKANQDHEQMQAIKPLILLFVAKYNEMHYKVDPDYEQQLEDSYHELLQYDKTKMLGLKGLITLRVAKKRYQDALFYAEKAFNLQPKTDWLLKYLIEIYLVLELYLQAEKIIKKASDCDFISKDEANSLLINNYITHANYCVVNSSVVEAVALLEKALKINPAHQDTVFILARLYSQDNNKKMAQRIIEKAWKKSPSVDLAKFMLSVYQEYNVNKKIKLLEELIDQALEDKSGYLALAELYIEEDMLPQARSVMDKLLAFYPPDSYMSKLMALIESKAQNNHSIITNWLYKI